MAGALAVAEAYRAAGDERHATEHAAEAERGFAQVVARIHDPAIREALVSASNGGPSSEGWSDDGEQPAPRGDPGPRSGRSRAFYERVLGLAFLELPVGSDMTSIWRGSPSEGTLAGDAGGRHVRDPRAPAGGTPDDDRFDERRIGIDHLAFGVDDRARLDELVERLRAEGSETVGVEHDSVLDKDYVAFRDPDNVQWEFYMR